MDNWIAKYVKREIDDSKGKLIESDYWNELFNILITQGDNNTEGLQTVINTLIEGILSETGAEYISTPLLGTSEDQPAQQNVNAALLWLSTKVIALDALRSLTGTSLMYHKEGVGNYSKLSDILDDMLQHMTTNVSHTSLTDKAEVDAHPMSSITGLLDALTGITAGELSAIPHNVLPDRTAPDAHTIASITGLQAHIDSLAQALTDIINIQNTIAAVTGAPAGIQHNTLLGLNEGYAHNVNNIEGVSELLTNYLTHLQGDERYQSKVLHGTEVPPDTLGSDGDLYVRTV